MKIWLPLVVVGLAGCGGSDSFRCVTSDQCSLSSQMGTCVQGPQVCALVDSSCASGYRYDNSAGRDLAGKCVDLAMPDLGADFAKPPASDMTVVGPDFSGIDMTVIPTDMGTVISSGTFMNGASINEKTAGPAQIIPGHFNADANLDLLVVRYIPYQSPTVELRLGTGNGTFAAGNVVWTGSDTTLTSSAYAVDADVNGDGKTDLIINAKGTVVSLISNGNGTFTTATWTTPGMGFTPGSAHFAAGDLNNDKKADLVTTYIGDVYVFTGDGAGQFTQSAHVANVASSVLNPHIYDINNDTKPDVAVSSSSLIAFMLGANDGTLGSKNTISAAAANSIVGDFAFGNFNGDANLDFLAEEISTSTGSFVYVSLIPGTNTGFGSVGTPVAIAKAVGALTTGDLDGNGVLDAVFVSSDATGTNGQGLYVLLNSNMGLGMPLKYATGFLADATNSASQVSVRVSQFNADLIPDLVACGNSGGPNGNGDAWFYAGQ